MGMNGMILVAFLFSLPANELFVPISLMLLTGTSSLNGVTGVGDILLEQMTWKMAVCTMVFTVFHWPCATTLLTIRQETHSIKKTAVAFLLPTAVGVLVCLILNLLL
jgi:ferrous iron transport protein B